MHDTPVDGTDGDETTDEVSSELDAYEAIGDKALPTSADAEASLAGSIPASGLPHYSTSEDEPVYFYGGPFSNFVGGPFKVKSDQPWMKDYVAVYPTIEHFFQASKATNIDDHERIRRAPGPWQAKKRGRTVPLREDWEQPVQSESGHTTKFDVMLVGLRAKFAEEPWRSELLETGDREIAEDSPTDAIWGIRGLDGQLSGQNLLGKALMQVRTEIREEA